MSKKLYVGNLPFSSSEDELRTAFDAYGVNSVNVISDRETGRPRGFAFVEVNDGDRAISEMNGANVGGRAIVVNEARERAPRQGGYQGGGQQGGGYGRQGGR